MNAQATVKVNAGTRLQEALKTASRQLQAKLIKDARNKALCVCLQYVGDNGYCPVHGPGFSNVTPGGAHD